MKPPPDPRAKAYRSRLGLPTQSSTKKFFAARDIVPSVDLAYVKELSSRVESMVRLLNDEIHPSVKWSDMDGFCATYVHAPTSAILSRGLLASMNNQGRRPEEVFFSWLRGYTILEFFTPALAYILGTPMSRVTRIGDDDLTRPETFRRTARADLEIEVSGSKLRIEAQTGLQGVNDIKEHKVKEAQSLRSTSKIGTLCAHFDIYNGRAAIFSLHDFFPDESMWVTRPQMEGQRVTPIPPPYFGWEFCTPAPSWPSGWSTVK